jgi:hypothetical protein
VNVSVNPGAIVSKVKSIVLFTVSITIDQEFINDPDIKLKLPDKYETVPVE